MGVAEYPKADDMKVKDDLKTLVEMRHHKPA